MQAMGKEHLIEPRMEGTGNGKESLQRDDKFRYLCDMISARVEQMPWCSSVTRGLSGRKFREFIQQLI